MNKIISSILIFFAIVFLANCSKRKVEAYPEAKKLFFLNTQDTLDILQTDEPLAEKIGFISATDDVAVLASIAIDSKTMVYSTYQIKCPPSVTHKCKSEYAYVKTLDVAGQDIISANSSVSVRGTPKAILLTKEAFKEATLLKKIIQDPKLASDSIQLTNFQVFDYLLSAFALSADDLLLKTEEFYQITKLIQNNTLEDNYLSALVKKYTILKSKDESGQFTSITSNADFNEKIAEKRNSLITSLITGFPLRSSTFKGLVIQFNKLKSFPYLTEKLFEYHTRDGSFTSTGSDFQYFVQASTISNAIEKIKRLDPSYDPSKTIACFRVENSEGYNYSLKISSIDGLGNIRNEVYPIVQISAEESGNSLGYKVKTDSIDFILTPIETPPSLLIAGQGFKEFLKGIPNDHKEIIKNNDYSKAIMLIALKFGEGGFEETTGKMSYSLSAIKRYWIMLDLFRFHPRIERSTDYSGTFKDSLSDYESLSAEGVCYYNLKWRQPKGELYLSGHWDDCYTDMGSSKETSEEICFFEGSSNAFLIQFSPSELVLEKPEVVVEYKSSSDLCKVIGIVMNK
jgi:hypothetical protein